MRLISRTLFVGFYGSFHPYVEQGEGQHEDAYSLFAARAAAMGWDSNGQLGSQGGLWGMNDASLGSAAEAEGSLVAWFQVGLANEVPPAAPLPVQPLLTCARDSVERLGELELDGVQLFLPAQTGPGARLHALAGLNWFNVRHRSARVRIRATCDAGDDQAFRERGPAILAALQSLKADDFAFESHSVGDSSSLEPAVVGEMWMGEGHSRVSFHGVIPEWSTEALGLFAALVWETCRDEAPETSLLISLIRASDEQPA